MRMPYTRSIQARARGLCDVQTQLQLRVTPDLSPVLAECPLPNPSFTKPTKHARQLLLLSVSS